MNKNYLESYWTELYRPHKIDDNLIIKESMREKFEEYIKTKQLPHLLFVGPAGTGKTTVAMTLVNEIIKDEMDCLKINGSVDNGVDMIRDRIMTFIATPPMASDIKIVYIDECDYLSQNAFAALRATIEQPDFNKKLLTRFIFTANYLSKIPEPIISRFTVFKLDSLSREDMVERCRYILDKENIPFNASVVNKIIDMYYPDMRSVIKNLQMSCVNGILSESNIVNVGLEIINVINDLIKATDQFTINELISRSRELITDEIDAPELLSKLMEANKDDIRFFGIILKYYNAVSINTVPRFTLIAMVQEIAQVKFRT